MMYLEGHGGDLERANFEEYENDADVLAKSLFGGPIFATAIRLMWDIKKRDRMNEVICMFILPRSLEYFNRFLGTASNSRHSCYKQASIHKAHSLLPLLSRAISQRTRRVLPASATFRRKQVSIHETESLPLVRSKQASIHEVRSLPPI